MLLQVGNGFKDEDLGLTCTARSKARLLHGDESLSVDVNVDSSLDQIV